MWCDRYFIGRFSRDVEPFERKAFGEMARGYVQNASYPARRDDLVAFARDQGADQVVLDAIIMIPSQEYRDPDAVIVEIEAVPS